MALANPEMSMLETQVVAAAAAAAAANDMNPMKEVMAELIESPLIPHGWVLVIPPVVVSRT